MQAKFNNTFFKNNRQQLRSVLASDVPIFIVGNGTLQRNRDNNYAFRQNSNFWYLTGLEEPDAILIVYKNTEYLVIPDYDFVHAYFEGSVDAVALSKISGIANILQYKQAWPLIKKIAREHGAIAMNEPDPVLDRMHRIFTNPAPAHFLQRLKRQNSKLKVQDVRMELMNLRWIKQQPEIDALQHAIDVTTEAFKSVQQKMHKYTHESHIDADISHHYTMNGCKHAYTPIVGAAGRSCTLHYTDNNNAVNTGNVVLIDSGAEYYNYAADITRTFVKGKATNLQKQVILAVTEALEEVVSLLKPGVSLYDIVMEKELIIGRHLKNLKLINDAKSRSQIQKYYPHAPHFLGLDVHDVGDYRRPLEAGVVLTMEPGIYIPEKAVGVRIEDDILITDTGCDVLSKNLPKHFVVD